MRTMLLCFLAAILSLLPTRALSDSIATIPAPDDLESRVAMVQGLARIQLPDNDDSLEEYWVIGDFTPTPPGPTLDAVWGAVGHWVLSPGKAGRWQPAPSVVFQASGRFHVTEVLRNKPEQMDWPFHWAIPIALAHMSPPPYPMGDTISRESPFCRRVPSTILCRINPGAPDGQEFWPACAIPADARQRIIQAFGIVSGLPLDVTKLYLNADRLEEATRVRVPLVEAEVCRVLGEADHLDTATVHEVLRVPDDPFPDGVSRPALICVLLRCTSATIASDVRDELVRAVEGATTIAEVYPIALGVYAFWSDPSYAKNPWYQYDDAADILRAIDRKAKLLGGKGSQADDIASMLVKSDIREIDPRPTQQRIDDYLHSLGHPKSPPPQH